MCGLGGVFYKTTEHEQKTGEIAYRILEGIYRRGPDSTGVALWQPNENGLLYVGINCEVPGTGAAVIERLDELGTVKEACDGNGFVRAAIAYDGADEELVDAIDALGPGITVGHIGGHVEVIKHMGGVANLEANFHLKDYDGQVAMGLTRFATESSIDFTHAQPLSARANRDLALMHNGHITNYHWLRYVYEQMGYRFATRNDSEIIPVMLLDEMNKGASLEEALKISVDKLDGCFTYIVVTADKVGVVKDRYASKPMVVGETDAFVALASDSQSLREGVLTDVEVWELGAEEVATWQL